MTDVKYVNVVMDQEDKLNWWQELVVIVWFIYTPQRYEEYTYWVGTGMRKKYAFEMAKKI